VTHPAAAGAYQVIGTETTYHGSVVTVRRDLVTMPGGAVVGRDVVAHPGAVGVVALDESDRVMMLRQYRHPVGRELWELPAGLLDVAGEPASVAAARELAEEAALTAKRWDVLVDVYSSPGMTDEAYRVFLARDIAEVPVGERFVGHDEEADMKHAWVDLDDAVARVMAGHVVNAMAVIGILATAQARSNNFAALRPADAVWTARPAHAG
jgi:8-oxo-dGTP pyrophosphatase MutT (NUDIX family)